MTIGCDGFLVSDVNYGHVAATSTAVLMLSIAMLAWCGAGLWLRKKYGKVGGPAMFEKTRIRDKIDQMLTEARVILPGVQGIFGFQLLIPMTDAFERLPKSVQHWHCAAVFLMSLSIILLIAPAAIHRVAFQMSDDPHFLLLGSKLVSWALAPLMAAIAADFYVATGRMVGYGPASALGGMLVFAALLWAWYLWPWAIRIRRDGIPVASGQRGSRKNPMNTA